MGRKRGQKSVPETPISAADENDRGNEAEEGEKGSRFFACYLLTSLCPRFKGHTYIGYTVNPRRRIRQHNGEIGCGAWRTKRKRPWEMVLCIYGFPTNVAALQFEWAWQHPVESLEVRKAAAAFKSLSGLANKIKLAYTMLTLPSWQSMNLTVNLFSTKYQKHTSGCPPLPGHMRTQVGQMDDLPCYNTDMFLNNDCDDEEEEEYDDIIYSTSSRPTEEAAAVAAARNVSPGSLKENVQEQINHSDDPIVDSTTFFAVTQPTNLPPNNEHTGQQSSISNGSPSVLSQFSNPPSIVQVLTPEVNKPVTSLQQGATSFVAEKDRCSIKIWNFSDEDVEVIDILSASPCYILNSCSKKRRARDQCPEVIDLTNSPLFV